METKKPIYKKWWFWVIIILVVLAAMPGSMSQPSGEAAKSEPVESVKPVESETVTEEDPVETCLDNAGIKDATVNIKDDYIEISYTLESTPYDYTDYVSKGLTNYVKTAKEIFENTDYTMYRMDMLVDGTAATSLIMTKDNFNSIDWSSIAYTEGIYDQIQGSFQKFYVETMLMKGVDTNKIMYKGK